jgi:streptogramin lyase
VSTFAGTGAPGPTPDGSPIRGTPLHGPRSLDFDARGDLWLVTREGNQLLRVDLGAGRFLLQAGTGRSGFSGNGGPGRSAALGGPKGVAVGPDGRVYLADTENHAIRRFDPRTGVLELVAGDGVAGDGPRLRRPHGVWVEPDGTLLVGDSDNHRILRIGDGP